MFFLTANWVYIRMKFGLLVFLFFVGVIMIGFFLIPGSCPIAMAVNSEQFENKKLGKSSDLLDREALELLVGIRRSENQETTVDPDLGVKITADDHTEKTLNNLVDGLEYETLEGFDENRTWIDFEDPSNFDVLREEPLDNYLETEVDLTIDSQEKGEE